MERLYQVQLITILIELCKVTVKKQRIHGLVWACSTNMQQVKLTSWIQHLITLASTKKYQFESDIFYPSRLLLNGLPLKVMFQRHKSNFTLLSAPENPAFHFQHFQHFKVSFQEVISSLHKVQLCPHKFHSIQQRLEKNTSPIYSQPC